MADTPVAHSYITSLEDLAARLAGDPRPNVTAFLALSDSAKTWYLQTATRKIDSLYLKGRKYSYTNIEDDDEVAVLEFVYQELQFPRVIQNRICDLLEDGVTVDVPEDVKRATVEEALALYESYVASPSDQKRRKLQEQGVVEYTLGSLSETFGSVAVSTKLKGLHSQNAYDYMKSYIAGSVRPIP